MNALAAPPASAAPRPEPMRARGDVRPGPDQAAMLTEMATKKPKRVDRPVTFPPCSKASGNTVFAIMQSIAPPHKPSMPAMSFITNGSSLLPGGKIDAPTAAPMPVMIAMEAHMAKMTLLRMPCKRIVPAEDIASGKLARKTPTTKASNVPRVAVLTKMPMTTLSGTPSIKIPSQIVKAACTPRPPWPPWPPWPCSPCSPPFSPSGEGSAVLPSTEIVSFCAAAVLLASKSGRSAAVKPP
mmetsp:Transcript_89204/g.257170  ORF Transcript_89204/g.257170 Transcript_89204/m.257170 type:complete len:240 (+) Transcript_89204:166-885(+)